MRRFFRSLSGRFLVLTIVFVMLAEVFIFVPSVARFREDYMLDRLERAQIASLAAVADEGPIDPVLEYELLRNAGVFNVVLQREDARQLMLSSEMPGEIAATYDLRDATVLDLIVQAMMRLFRSDEEVIRVIGQPAQNAGTSIEVTMPTVAMRQAMIDYGLRVLALSAVISIFTAALLFLTVRAFIVAPIKGVVDAMKSYAAAPEDTRRIIEPSADVTELREAEETLRQLESEMTQLLRQKERLAALGSAVAKVSHDLRNILASAQLFADRMETSADPTVRRLAPKLLGSISRAVNLCEATLAFGKAEEPAPRLARIGLAVIVADVIESERLSAGDDIGFAEEVPPGLTIRADPEQLFRILSNLVRNARQAIETTGGAGTVTIRAEEDPGAWRILVIDTGPGLPQKAREHLFTAFQGGARKGGTGLGLAIASELVRGHGGRLALERSDTAGTTFAVDLPKTIVVPVDSAAE